jgi:hypothetical protein
MHFSQVATICVRLWRVGMEWHTLTHMTIHAMPQGESKPTNERVGQNVRMIAALRGKSQLELAVTLGVDESSMSRRINGKTDWSPDEMEKAASLLGVKVWRLFASLPDLDSNQEPIGSRPVAYLFAPKAIIA